MGKVLIQLPDDAEVGDTITFEVEGQTLSFEVPIGSNPGDVLEIETDGFHSHSALTESEGICSIQLFSGETMSIHGNSSDSMNIEDGSDGTHAMAWQAGRALVEYMSCPRFQQMIRENCSSATIELGSGLGTVGIAFAHAVSRLSPYGTSQVILTDLPSALPLLIKNVERNRHLVSPWINMLATPLVWHNFPTSATSSRLDWIIGSDLLYNHQSIPALASTIQRLVSPSTKLLLAVRWRKPELERDFFLRLDHILDWTLLAGNCSLSWRDYGNPECESSNRFFSQTLVSVKGVPTPISEINEISMELMESEEYQAFERMQVQIYLGNAKSPYQSGSKRKTPS